MRRTAAVPVLALLLAGCVPAQAPPPPAETVTVTPEPVVVTEPPVEPEPAPTPGGWAGTAERVRSGVVHLAVTDCYGEGAVGSGSLVAPDVVLTAAHVVEDALTVTLRTAEQVVTGEVVLLDVDRDLAVVRAAEDLTGHVFTLSVEDPPAGTAVAALGYPLDQDLSITDGIVSATREAFTDEGRDHPAVILTSAALNPGNSGGPLVLQDGTQVGVAVAVQLQGDGQTRAEGRGVVVAGREAAGAVERATTSSGADEAPGCEGFGDGREPDWGASEGPDSPFDPFGLTVEILSGDPRAPVFGQLLAQHGQGINEADWETAFGLFTPEMQERLGGQERWTEGLWTTYWRWVSVRHVVDAAGGVVVTAMIQTDQSAADGHEGQECSIFDLTYTFVEAPDTPLGWQLARTDAPAPTEC